MKLFHSTYDEYYDAGVGEFPLPIRCVRNVALAIVWAFALCMWRARMEDERYMLERSDGKGTVIICNHTSMAEVVSICTYLWRRGRVFRPIFKSEFGSHRIVEWVFSRAGGIPVERGTADMKSLRRAQHALQRGEDVLIFPEGTRIRTDEQPVEVHGGFALMAQMGKTDITPMAVCGFRDITPAGKKVPRPKKCWMRAGEHVSFSDAPEGMKRRERSQWVEDLAVSRMYALRDQLRAEHPGRF